jgi:hypothetical protein
LLAVQVSRLKTWDHSAIALSKLANTPAQFKSAMNGENHDVHFNPTTYQMFVDFDGAIKNHLSYGTGYGDRTFGFRSRIR